MGPPDDERFRFHLTRVGKLGGYLCGRRLYETMLPWETEPSMRDGELGAAFASRVVYDRYRRASG